MPRTTATLPEHQVIMLEKAISKGEFSSKSQGIQTALTEQFENERLRATAVQALYSTGEIEAREAIELADLDDRELRAVLQNQLGLGEETQKSGEEDILDSIVGDFEIDTPNKDN